MEIERVDLVGNTLWLYYRKGGYYHLCGDLETADIESREKTKIVIPDDSWIADYDVLDDGTLYVMSTKNDLWRFKEEWDKITTIPLQSIQDFGELTLKEIFERGMILVDGFPRIDGREVFQRMIVADGEIVVLATVTDH